MNNRHKIILPYTDFLFLTHCVYNRGANVTHRKETWELICKFSLQFFRFASDRRFVCVNIVNSVTKLVFSCFKFSLRDGFSGGCDFFTSWKSSSETKQKNIPRKIIYIPMFLSPDTNNHSMDYLCLHTKADMDTNYFPYYNSLSFLRLAAYLSCIIVCMMAISL